MINYFNGYTKVNNPSYLAECHYPCAMMLQMLLVYCDTTCLLKFGRPSVVQCENTIGVFYMANCMQS